MFKKVAFILLCCLPAFVFGQTNTLTGNIFDNDNRTNALEGATIKNLNTKAFTLTDKDGHFAIAAKVGDLISFGMVGYQTDTVYLTNLFPKNIFLRVFVNTLNSVNVTTAKISPYLDVKDPNAAPARAVDYSKNRGGLRFGLGFGKIRKEQAKIRELEENEKWQEEISKNFNEKFIRDLVKFEGDDIKDFIALYRPTVEQVKSEQPFNYAYYTAKAYRTWLKLPPEQRKLPPLPKLKANN
jgi:hypothetical protein